jgi:signal peptidase I
MEPSLAEGDVVLAFAGRTPRTGDVVVVDHPGRPGLELVKRVVGSPGEIVHLLSNGSRLPEPVPLGAGEWFVVGDAPGSSTDSRSFGPVGRGHLRGAVAFVLTPRGRRGRVR